MTIEEKLARYVHQFNYDDPFAGIGSSEEFFFENTSLTLDVSQELFQQSDAAFELDSIQSSIDFFDVFS